jgi:putative membrane protein
MKNKFNLSLILKGMAMGAANVIPGVSGGTIALITGIYEDLIDSIKSFDLHALKLLTQLKWKEFAKYTNLYFLIQVLLGLVLAIFSLAKLFKYLFEHYPVYIWAFFFGLVLASVYYVGKTVTKWNFSSIISFILGLIIALAVTILHPAGENDNPLYLFFNGIIAIISMILPGLSGSFVLILLGNYQLIAIDAINQLNFRILLPFLVGAVIGLIAFSYILSWLFKRYKNQTIALMTGFIVGSLNILWPWKKPVYLIKEGEFVTKHGKKLIAYYEQVLPSAINKEFFVAVIFMLLGVWLIYFMEKKSNNKI